MKTVLACLLLAVDFVVLASVALLARRNFTFSVGDDEVRTARLVTVLFYVVPLAHVGFTSTIAVDYLLHGDA